MTNVIRYMQDGEYFILNPSPFSEMPLEAIAAKDVPYGCPWEIINREDLPPSPEPEQVVAIPAVTFWERTTEAEGNAIEAMLNRQPFRVRQIFMTAQSYRSDHELWPLLQSAAVQLFGQDRADELLKGE